MADNFLLHNGKMVAGARIERALAVPKTAAFPLGYPAMGCARDSNPMSGTTIRRFTVKLRTNLAGSERIERS